MITLDSEDITITYPDLYFLMRDIQVSTRTNTAYSQKLFFYLFMRFTATFVYLIDFGGLV